MRLSPVKRIPFHKLSRFQSEVLFYGVPAFWPYMKNLKNLSRREAKMWADGLQYVRAVPHAVGKEKHSVRTFRQRLSVSLARF